MLLGRYPYTYIRAKKKTLACKSCARLMPPQKISDQGLAVQAAKKASQAVSNSAKMMICCCFKGTKGAHASALGP